VKRLTFFLLAAWIAAITAPAAFAQLKYVAVVETELDATSGAVNDLSAAEVRQITTELRREAVKNLPRAKYNVMTSETVQAQGGAVLEECADENCVIILGSKIGADYIVRGIISKFKTLLTLSIEMYETENGTLVASSEPVRSENAAELLMLAAAASADMYKMFTGTQGPVAQGSAPKAAVRYTVAAAANPAEGGAVSRNPDQTNYAPGTKVSLTAAAADGYAFNGWSGDATGRKNRLTVTVNGDKAVTANFYRQSAAAPVEKNAAKAGDDRDDEMELERRPMTGVSLGCNFSPNDGGHVAGQLGIVHSRPISERMVSLNVEGNILAGVASYPYYGESFSFFGINVPLTVLLQLYFFSLEVGVDGDVFFGDDETLFNAGFVVGAGIGFSKQHSRRYFYRYCGGINYGTHFVGMWWLF